MNSDTFENLFSSALVDVFGSPEEMEVNLRMKLEKYTKGKQTATAIEIAQFSYVESTSQCIKLLHTVLSKALISEA